MKDISSYNTPGQLIQDLLESRQWTQEILAIVLDMNKSSLNQIIAGRKTVDAKLALALSEIFGCDAELFLKLQSKYSLAKAKITLRENHFLEQRAKLFSNLPVKEMAKRGWINITNINDFPSVESSVANFFKVNKIDDIEVLPHAAKKTHASNSVSPAQLAWLYRVKEIASEMMVKRFSVDLVKDALPKLKDLMISPTEVSKVSRILSDCGIRFLIVEGLKGSKVDGACMWLDDNSPVIGMSLRFDRIDNFWFVLRHEIEHVIQGHGKNSMILDIDIGSEIEASPESIQEEERIANLAAENFCIPQKEMKSFILRKSPFFTERDIIGFAKTLHVHPGLVAGQLRYKLKIYNRFSNHLAKIKSELSNGTTIDGWGNIVPIG